MTRIEPANTDPILDPTYASSEAREHFKAQLGVAREIAEYGSQLLKRLFATSPRDNVSDIVVIAVLLRQALAAFDACVLCLEGGAVAAANVHVRGLLEVALYTQWILTQDKQRWARQFYVASIRQEREWARRGISGTPESDALQEAWKETFAAGFDVTPEVAAEAAKTETEIKRILALPAYAEIDKWFNEKKGSSLVEPDWYKPGPGAPTSIYDLSRRLKKRAYYLSAYKSLSYDVHGSRAKSGFRYKGDGIVTIQPVRLLTEFPNTFRLAVPLVLGIYRQLLEHYRPDEMPQFAKTHERWKPHLTPPDVVENVIPVRA